MPLLPSREEWEMIKEQANVLVKSGFLSPAINTPEKAIAIALKGREMGIPMMQAFSHISIINGKPCISAELQLSQIYRLVPGAQVQIEKNTDEGAVVLGARPGRKMVPFEFSKADAQTAGLLDKGPWKAFPKSMYLWRAVTMMARVIFPDAIMGASYTPEEMGADVNEDGEVLSIPVTPEPRKAANQISQDKKKSANIPIYDKKNAHQKAECEAYFKKSGIPDRYLSELHDLLHGQPTTDAAILARKILEQMEIDKQLKTHEAQVGL